MADGAWRAWLRRAFYDLRIEGEGPVREALALGLGMFIGCTPFYGAHLLICYVVGRLAGLNRLKMIVASNISNPLFSPFLVLSELQIGAWVRRGAFHDLTLETFRRIGPWTFGADLLLGSLIVGATLGLLVGTVAYITGKSRHEDADFAVLRRRAADPYLQAGIIAWEIARARLRSDPIYRLMISAGFVPGGTVVDMACGRALTLSLLAASGEPRILFGIEKDPQRAAVAVRALNGKATIVVGDATRVPLPPADAVLLIDALGAVPPPEQDALIDTAVNALRPGGVMLVRDNDGAPARRFFTRRRRSFHRTRTEWIQRLRRDDLTVEVVRVDGTSSAGFVLRCVRSCEDTALDERSNPSDHGTRPPVGIELAAEPDATT